MLSSVTAAFNPGRARVSVVTTRLFLAVPYTTFVSSVSCLLLTADPLAFLRVPESLSTACLPLSPAAGSCLIASGVKYMHLVFTRLPVFSSVLSVCLFSVCMVVVASGVLSSPECVYERV